MSMFQARHYEAIAVTLRDTKPSPGSNPLIVWEQTMLRFVHMLTKDNPKFDRGRFEARICGDKPRGPEIARTWSNEAPIHEFKRAPIISSSTRDV